MIRNILQSVKVTRGGEIRPAGLHSMLGKNILEFIQNIYIIQEPVFLHVFVRLIALNFGM